MQTKLRKILWPTDFSELSMKAADYARGLCELFDAELHILHVCTPVTVPPELLGTWPVTTAFASFDSDARQAAAKRLHRLAAERFDNIEKVICEALTGQPWPVICEYAKHTDIDLIVIATHGLTGIKHVVIGSTAERIVQHALCPVLTVKAWGKDFVMPVNG